VKAREVIRAIQRAGGVETRQVGSHKRFVVDYTKMDGTPAKAFTTVAVHGGDIPHGTLVSIEKALEPALGKGWLQK
jgi:predicted RNA binding protein YcfA (HicA-like mRNA interferase family)